MISKVLTLLGAVLVLSGLINLVIVFSRFVLEEYPIGHAASPRILVWFAVLGTLLGAALYGGYRVFIGYW